MTTSSLAPGFRIGPYTIIEPLGAGGMAQVYIARRDGADRVCVLKLLHLELEGHGQAPQRFQREANIASRLDHPCIAPVLDAGRADDRFFLTMPLIEGVTVEALIEAAKAKGGVLPFEVSVPLALQALDALAYAHALTDPEGRPLGLVHRDLSPRNLMLGFDGRLRIIDFGVAKGQVDELKTASGVLMGTPFYMAPEQAHGLRVDHRADLYTIAAVLFEMLTGWRLARGKGRIQIMLSVTNDLPPRPSKLNLHAPAALDDVLLKALSKAPNERYANAEEFAAAIRKDAGVLAGLDEARTARFVQALLPEEVAQAKLRNSPVAPSPMSEPGGADTQTRTAAVGGTGAVAPLPLDPIELEHMGTRTALLSNARPDVDTARIPPRSRLGGWSIAALAVLGGLAATLGYVGRTSLVSAPVAPTSVRAPRPPPTRPAARPVVAAPAAAPLPEVAAAPAEVAAAPAEATKRRLPSTPAAAPEPARTAPAPARPADPLRRRYSALRASRDRGDALTLARDLGRRADALPPDAAARVRSEIERVYLTANVDSMIEALGAAIAALPR